MNKINNDSLALGISLGLLFGLVFDNLALGLALGTALGVSGILKSKKRNKQRCSIELPLLK